MKTLSLASAFLVALTSSTLAQGCPSPARVRSIQITGSGGLGSAELVVNLEPGGPVRVDNFAAPQVFAAMATVLNHAMATQQLIEVSCVPQPPGYPLLSQVVIFRPGILNRRLANKHRHIH